MNTVKFVNKLYEDDLKQALVNDLRGNSASLFAGSTTTMTES